MATLVAALFLLVALVLLGRWFMTADVAALARWLRSGGFKAVALGVGLLLVLGALVTGKLAALLGFVPFLAAWIFQSRGVLNRWKASQGPTPGQASTVRTRTLEMSLDHDTGHTTGQVIAGPFMGRQLTDMSRDELLALLTDCAQNDAQSVPLLEAFLDRVHGPTWRELGGAAGESGGVMSRHEAYAVLGLAAGASEQAIRAAHRRPTQDPPPDPGGPPHPAAPTNPATDRVSGPS